MQNKYFVQFHNLDTPNGLSPLWMCVYMYAIAIFFASFSFNL